MSESGFEITTGLVRAKPAVPMTAVLVVVVVFAVVALVVQGARPASAFQGATGKRSTWDGVYTDAQAKRGKEAYDYSCAMCHAPSLEGDSSRDVPALAGDEFLDGWNARPVKSLFDVVSKSMPKDAPGSLRAQTYADLLAYLLQVSEFPAGDRELAPDAAGLEQIRIEKMPAKGAR